VKQISAYKYFFTLWAGYDNCASTATVASDGNKRWQQVTATSDGNKRRQQATATSDGNKRRQQATATSDGNK
jgi:hypothetical protein